MQAGTDTRMKQVDELCMPLVVEPLNPVSQAEAVADSAYGALGLSLRWNGSKLHAKTVTQGGMPQLHTVHCLYSDYKLVTCQGHRSWVSTLSASDIKALRHIILHASTKRYLLSLSWCPAYPGGAVLTFRSCNLLQSKGRPTVHSAD
jgi:hypothetical protein